MPSRKQTLLVSVSLLQKRHIYKCGKCYTGLKKAPAPNRIVPGSSYSDEMIIDIALNKYCDLIPIERYASIVRRQNLIDLPPTSLIELTHKLALFLEPVWQKLIKNTLISKVLRGDETPHKMLEGDVKKNWQLWGFSSEKECFFDIRDTRSGDIAYEYLKNSQCEYLMTDVFSGYRKAVKTTNKDRKEKDKSLIKNIYCNAHSRRKFIEAKNSYYDESMFFVNKYKKIYKLEKIKKALEDPVKKLRVRKMMKYYFIKMYDKIELTQNGFSSQSKMGKAMKYFINNYSELTLFTDNIDLPIDNNKQESLFRSPVVGRKTWYGTHSKVGAKTASILFSIIEACKMNDVNPREYFPDLVNDIHSGNNFYTPYEYSVNKSDNSNNSAR